MPQVYKSGVEATNPNTTLRNKYATKLINAIKNEDTSNFMNSTFSKDAQKIFHKTIAKIDEYEKLSSDEENKSAAESALNDAIKLYETFIERFLNKHKTLDAFLMFISLFDRLKKCK